MLNYVLWQSATSGRSSVFLLRTSTIEEIKVQTFMCFSPPFWKHDNVRERNIQARSRNHYWCGKAVSTTNSGLRDGAVGWGTADKSRKVAGSIPDGVMGIFHWFNPSGRTMALGSTHLLKEWVPGVSPGGKGGRCIGLTTLQLSCAEFLYICCESHLFSRPVME